MQKFFRQIFKLFLSLLIIGVAFGFYMAYAPYNSIKSWLIFQAGYPVLKVGNQIVSGRELFSKIEIYKNTEKNEPGAEVIKKLFEAEIEQRIVSNIAEQNDINIDEVMLNEELKRYVRLHGQESSLESFLKQNSLSTQEFKQIVLKPALKTALLKTWFYGKPSLNPESKNRLENISKLISEGVSFEQVASESALDSFLQAYGGDIGPRDILDLNYEFAKEATGLKTDELKPIADRTGLYLVKKESPLEGDGKTSLRLKVIYLGGGDFESWFNQQKQKIKIINLVRI